MASLKLEIVQELPFSSVEEEALLNMMRTTDTLQRAFHLKIRDFGVSSTQYNVLRILRGAQPHGLTCASIGSRMITAEPDVTRILTRLKTLKFVLQHRDRHDKRVVWTKISEAGLDLLTSMDPLIKQLPIDLLGHLKKEELLELIRLLEHARNSESKASLSCDGSHEASSQTKE